MALRPNNPQDRTPASVSRDEAQQEGFMREVDEALRQDEAVAMARRWAKPVGLAVAVALLGLAGYLGWDHYREQQREAFAEKFTGALDQLRAGNLAAADKRLVPLASEGEPGARAGAIMLEAGIAAEQGKPADAAKLFGRVAAMSDAPQPYRDLARIREIALRYDSMAPDRVVAALKPLAQPGKPFFGSAGELLGLAYVKQGKPELAGPLFAAMARDKTVPESLRVRARQMAGTLGVDAVDDPEQVALGTAGQGSE